ncbi:F-actin-uncapping protein LRRC16A-like, partial [Homalodisca vitripennis]|uniref:F-actin-uncapping protein LRRC16A-like n=1 Tax=Homalodisca vitripennis TaxID=197043 RepID=UPI001EEBBD7F
MRTQAVREVDAMVQALATAIRNIFPTVPLTHIIRKVEVVPAKRIAHLRESEFTRASEVRGLGPCDGFSTQYACMCDYHTMPYREEVAWDVDTIYLSHDTRELCLRDFDHLDPKDLVPIISALEYNTWFTKLRASHIKLTHEALDRILHIMKKNLTIEELYLDNLAVKWEFAHKLSLSLIANKQYSPTYSGSEPVTLSTPLSKVSKGLIHLKRVTIAASPSKGVKPTRTRSVPQQAHAPTPSPTFNLSGNNLKEDVN